MKDMKYIIKENKKMLTVHVCIVRKICRNSCCCRISVQQRPIQPNLATMVLRSCSVTYLLCIRLPIC
jgi:hypothetical protein